MDRTGNVRASSGAVTGDAGLAHRHAVDAANQDGILVLEDINEHPFRVERMLLQLYHAGILDRQSAIVLGSFSGSAPNDYDAGYPGNDGRFHPLAAGYSGYHRSGFRS